MKKINKSSDCPQLSLLRDIAMESAEAAGKVLLRYFGGKFQVSKKKGAGLVTNADIEAQEKIVRILQKSFPDFGFLTEEAQPILSESPGRWIIDPLDGTTNFVHGFPMFCVSIAAEWNGERVAGVIYHPILKDFYEATLGKGAKLNSRTLSVSKTPKLQDALLTTGFTYRKGSHLQTEMETFEKLSTLTRAIRRPGSAALELAYIARGVFDGSWERNLSPWDVAAGALIVTEAGGQVTDFQGNPFRIDGGELLASNKRLHKSLLKKIS